MESTRWTQVVTSLLPGAKSAHEHGITKFNMIEAVCFYLIKLILL